MNQVELKKCLAVEYFKYAIDLYCKNSKVDDYDIRTYSGKEYEEIANSKLAILTLVKDLGEEYGSNIRYNVAYPMIEVFSDDILKPHKTFTLLISKQMTFSGTIGINDIQNDGGLSKHLWYLRLFFDRSDINQLNNIRVIGDSEEDIVHSYVEFYQSLCKIMQANPISLYKLLTGLKKAYDVPDCAILLDDSNYRVLDFSKINDSRFINSFEDFSFEASDTSPYLKIKFQGNKLMHIRTKTDVKNNSFKLRLFIETSSKFLKLFEKE